MKSILIILALAMLTACADSHKLTRVGSHKDQPLTGSESIYISTSQDGVYESKTYKGSGVNTTQILKSSFAKHARRVQSSRSHETYDAALQYAKSNKFDVLVYPTILHWEDRATEWSGIPDKVEVKIEVVDLKTGKTIEEAVVSGKSGWATLGGDHPQDLLPKPTEDFVSSLYK